MIIYEAVGTPEFLIVVSAELCTHTYYRGALSKKYDFSFGAFRRFLFIIFLIYRRNADNQLTAAAAAGIRQLEQHEIAITNRSKRVKTKKKKQPQIN